MITSVVRVITMVMFLSGINLMIMFHDYGSWWQQFIALAITAAGFGFALAAHTCKSCHGCDRE